MSIKNVTLCLAVGLSFIISLPQQAYSVENTGKKDPLIIQEQGSFMAGGSVVAAKEKYNPLAPTPESQTLHGDHAYIFY